MVQIHSAPFRMTIPRQCQTMQKAFQAVPRQNQAKVHTSLTPLKPPAIP
jgi:hypothetical protein